jgi:RimJ/RimL family protein N-acetyltransferase
MNIKNKDITIRNAEKTDCEQLAIWWNDGKVMAHAGFPNGLGTTADEIRNQISSDMDETKRRLIIDYKGSSIGEMSYYNMGENIAEIGIKICDSLYQEKGLGKKILSMLIGELFARGYKKIILNTNLNNKRAQHVYETLGFSKVRENIDSWTNQVGEIQSSVDYELIPENFVDFT